MYFSEIKTKNKKALLGFFVLLGLLLQPIITWATYEENSPYPVYRGIVNPREIMAKLQINDANGQNEIYFVVGTDIMGTVQGNFRPGEIMTEAQALAAIINTTPEKDNMKVNPGNWKDGYIALATELGILTQEDLDVYADNRGELLDNPVTAAKFSRWLGRSLGTDTAYQGAPDSPINRATVAKAFYDKRDQLLPRMGYTHLRGEVKTTEEISENSLPKKVITLNLDDGSFANILSGGDIPFISGGKPTLNAGEISSAQKMSFYYKARAVQFGDIASTTSGITGGTGYSSQNGFLQSLNQESKSITLKDYQDQLKTYVIHPNITYFQMEGTPDFPGRAKTTDGGHLLLGQEIQLLIRDNMVTRVNSFLEQDTDQDGYIPAESRLISGKVKQIKQDAITLTDSKVYEISPDVFILAGGQLTDYRDIREGDLVKLYFDQPGSALVSKIEIEGQQRQVDTIIKGTFQSYATGRKELSLSNVQVLTGDRWNPSDNAYSQVKLRGDIYDGNKKLATARLKDYKGQEIYAILAKNQNSPTIEKANIRRGAGLSFSEQIKDIDFAGSYINIETNLINFTEGTLMVKDGRIVPAGSLQRYATAYVETSAAKNASLIVMTNTIHTPENKTYPYKLYRGTLRDVFDYSIQLGNDWPERYYYRMDTVKWNTYREESDGPRIAYTDNTYIYDAYKDGKGKMTVKDFRDLKYEGSRYDKRPSYYDKQIYVVTRDDVAVAILMISETGYNEVNTQNVMTGKMIQVTGDEKIEITLGEVSKYNALRNMFLFQTTTETVDISKAAIIRGDKAIDPKAIGAMKGKKVKVIYKQNTTKINNGIVVIIEN